MERDNVNMELIKQYIRGELPPREMYVLERRAQDDPMLMDIILGMEREAQEVHETNLTDIRKRILLRTGHGRTRRLVPLQRWAIAASVLIAITIGTWWSMRWNTVEQSQPMTAWAPADTPPSAAESSPQSTTPKTTETAAQAQRQLAAATTESIREEKAKDVVDTSNRSDRLAMNDESAEIVMDTLEPVVIVRYGKQEKSNITGAVSRIQAKDIEPPVKTQEQALAGRTTGIRIRGINNTQKAENRVITGKVVDQETQQPLQDVTIQTAGNHVVVTDSQGWFTVPDTAKTLTTSYIGYETQRVPIIEADSIIIALKPDVVETSEVVVVDYSTKKRNREVEVKAESHDENKAEPVNGWRAYNRYLKQQTKQANGPKGSVTLTFTIDQTGTPTHIQVVRTTHPTLSEQAIQILRDGPKWKPGKNGERQMELEVTF